MLHSKLETIQPFDFTILTCNALHEQYYVGFLGMVDDNKRYVQSTIMDISRRTELFRKALTNPVALQGADILCFQEWTFDVTPSALPQARHNDQITMDKGAGRVEQKTKYAYLSTDSVAGIKNFFNYLDAVFSDRSYEAISARTRSDSIDGLLVIYNTDKFERLGIKSASLKGGPKEALFIKLRVKAAPGILLGVITAHVPWERESLADQKQHYQKIFDLINSNKDVHYWVVCGDFNYNIWNDVTSQISNAKYQELLGLFTAQTGLQWESNVTFKSTIPTSYGGQQCQFNDYIFFTPGMHKRVAYYPERCDALIKHVNLPPYKHGSNWFADYFSDHAIVRMTLTIPTAPSGTVPVVPAAPAMPQKKVIVSDIFLVQQAPVGLPLFRDLLNGFLKSKYPAQTLYPDYFHTDLQSRYAQGKLVLKLNVPEQPLSNLPQQIQLDAITPIKDLMLIQRGNDWIVRLSLQFDPTRSQGIQAGFIDTGSVTTRPMEARGKVQLGTNPYQFVLDNKGELVRYLANSLKGLVISVPLLRIEDQRTGVTPITTLQELNALLA